MNALRRLERGGYRFALTAGRLSFSHNGTEPMPRPRVFLRPCSSAPLLLCSSAATVSAR